MARLPDVRSELKGEEKIIFEEMVAHRALRGKKLGGPFVPLMNHPKLAQLIEKMGFYLKFESILPRDVYQFIVLSAARRFRVAFIWMDHIGPAREAGLAEPVIEAVGKGDVSALDAPYFFVEQAMDSILAFRSIPEALQEEIIRIFGAKGLIEIVTLCGFYQLIGEINNSFDVPLPDTEKPPF
ncbi:MAG: carboxymuconolactone decarboxylase [bacterium]